MNASKIHLEARFFRRQIRLLTWTSWIPAVAAVMGYVVLMFQLSVVESFAIGICLLGWAVGVHLIAESDAALSLAPIFRLLENVSMQDGEGVDAGDARKVRRAFAMLPIRMQRSRWIGGFAPIVLVPPVMWMLGFEAWLSVERIRSLAVISLVVSLVSGVLIFYRTKQSLAHWRNVCAEILIGSDGRVDDPNRTVDDSNRAVDDSNRTVDDSGESVELGVRVSLRRKILLAVTIPTIAGVLLVVDISGQRQKILGERAAVEWAAVALEAVSTGDSNLSLGERLANQLPAKKFWPRPVEIVELDSASMEAPILFEGQFSESLKNSLRSEIESGRQIGSILPNSGPEIAAFRQVDDTKILVSVIRRADLGSYSEGLSGIAGLACLAAFGLAVVVARRTAWDICDGVAAISETASRMAAGDLGRSAHHYESDDELGEILESANSIRTSLGSSISRISKAVENVERISSGISARSADAVASNADQAQQVEQAKLILEGMKGRADDASLAVVSLKLAVEQSGESIEEFGATGEELNETASVLSARVDAVSGSLEQMIQSVKQVAGTSERLAAASEETSSSMEEMASSMRAVDTSAETTASLSRDVVSKAELGQAKVVQTIAGMEAIREATDAAESVIRGLGARTNEIGGILDVIDDVADETNLLALNAAIIAAQAGEQGKAFSVVADEIKELADRVLASTKEIGSLIRAVQEESENAIGAIEAGSASVMSGVDLSAEAGRTLEEITVASRESGMRITEIVASVREQTKAASHVAALMEKVRESAEEIGDAGNDQGRGHDVVYQSAQTMREVAQQVRYTTEEQARGIERVRENVKGVRRAAEQIAGSLTEQSGTCEQVSEFLERVSQGTRASEGAAQELREAMRALVSESEILREESRRFRI